eukprot:366395-Chlamydomonas_euryale.AAC.18
MTGRLYARGPHPAAPPLLVTRAVCDHIVRSSLSVVRRVHSRLLAAGHLGARACAVQRRADLLGHRLDLHRVGQPVADAQLGRLLPNRKAAACAICVFN